MRRICRTSRGAQLMLAGSVALLVTLFANWQRDDAEFLGISTFAAATGWNGVLGVSAGVVTVILVAYLALGLVGVAIHLSRGAERATAPVLAFAILALVVAKNVDDAHSTLWSYIGVALAATIVVGSLLELVSARARAVAQPPEHPPGVTYG